MYTYSLVIAVEKHWRPLSQTEGIPLVQQRQNTIFRLIKKKLETLLKQRTAEKHFGIYLESYLAKRYTSIMHFEDGTALSIHSCSTVMYKILCWLQPSLHTVRTVNPSNYKNLLVISDFTSNRATDQNIPIALTVAKIEAFFDEWISIFYESITSHKTRFVLQ